MSYRTQLAVHIHIDETDCYRSKSDPVELVQQVHGDRGSWVSGQKAHGQGLMGERTEGTGRGFGIGLVYWGLPPLQQPGSCQGGEMMMMKSVFWWRKPEYPEETTDLRQVTDETVHTYGLCPVRGLNLGRSGVKQSELRRDESDALAHRATAVPRQREQNRQKAQISTMKPHQLHVLVQTPCALHIQCGERSLI